ncbi:tyrosine-type recombinase/integrase [Streptomyces ferrugineus]|uniref:tyrosine-type recombinase/integrase n=1 Tax=Streptomyces ferrugineus TaxID=1413221 RepID=UPI00389A5CC0
MHSLRHFYASVLLDAGASIKAVSQYLGHSDPGLTLRVYVYLMPYWCDSPPPSSSVSSCALRIAASNCLTAYTQQGS